MKPREEYIARPILSLQNMLRVVAMGNPNLVTLIPDGIYGPETTAAVSAFQRHYRLPVTGVMNNATWARLSEVFHHISVEQSPSEPILILLEPGQIIVAGEGNDHVYLIQSMLSVLSQDDKAFPTPPINGIMDSPTVGSVRYFQQLSALPETGNVDRATWQHLAKLYAATAKDGTHKKRTPSAASAAPDV